ncbi:MAG: CoA transferase [Chloroflexi bacterium]|nr:CoA transferase [Chloroflexota bacterium]
MAFGLEGIKVIETASVIAGPTAGRFLADWGADVIHIEHPLTGDLLRGDVTRRLGFGGRVIQSDIPYGAQNVNRNKRGMTLDLSQEAGREVLDKLLDKADVLLSNFRPYELKKFKLEYETLSQLNPRLIQANITGFGKEGPDRDLPAVETAGYFARSGILHVLQMPGMPPFINPSGWGDCIVGLTVALGIMMALFVRERTGVAQEVDVSLFQTGVFTLAGDIAGALVTGQDRQHLDRQDILNPMVNSYQTKDGKWLKLGMSRAQQYWPRFCRAIEREELEHDPRFESIEARAENHAALFYILEEVFLTRTSEEWKVRLNEVELIWAAVQTLPEVIADPQARANGFFESLNLPIHGPVEVVANPIKLGKTPAAVRTPAPEFNQHTEEILLEHGYTWEDIARFKERSIIA